MRQDTGNHARPAPLSAQEWWWLAGGFAACALLYVVFTLGSYQYPDILRDGESGILENSQNVILAAALILAVIEARTSRGLLRLWLALVAIGLFFVLGEEASWGQNYLHWATPGWFEVHNGQHETNLHNTSALLNSVPRNLLRLAIFFGAVAYPVVRRFLKRDPFGVPPWLAPTLISLPPAVFATFTAFTNRVPLLNEYFGFDETYFEVSEVEELFFYLLFLTYLIGLRRRHRN